MWVGGCVYMCVCRCVCVWVCVCVCLSVYGIDCVYGSECGWVEVGVDVCFSSFSAFHHQLNMWVTCAEKLLAAPKRLTVAPHVVTYNVVYQLLTIKCLNSEMSTVEDQWTTTAHCVVASPAEVLRQVLACKFIWYQRLAQRIFVVGWKISSSSWIWRPLL